MHLEAISNNDYLQYAKPTFGGGLVIDFHRQLEQLSIHLQQLKSRYDQHVFLVYRLIEQLDSPIMVFNQQKQLTHANTAFNKLFPQPWQMFKYASPELLGLKFIDQGWRFKAQQQDSKWQIRHSEFIDQGKTHQLVVFVNIESALRKNQLNAWQQLIRVLGHEIRNSLTPVSTLAQGLGSKTQNVRDKQALAVINERCNHLQDFVSRYASVTRPFQLNYQLLATRNIAQRMQGLLKHIDLNTLFIAEKLWADPALIEQVLLNIIKNADEATVPIEHSPTVNKSSQKIQLIFRENACSSIIEVVDSGQGFANLDNLFVPLYSTKQNGQGIGLSFCRNIIEQHKGSIELVNNTPVPGVTVTIALPLFQAPRS